MSEMADRVEQFANRFVPKARVLTARLVSAQKWAKIDPYHMDAIAVRKEIAKFDPDFIRMLNDLVKLTEDCKPHIDGHKSPNAVPDDWANEQRIAAALGEMTALIKEYTQEYERWAALPNGFEDTNMEFLIGSHRFLPGAAKPTFTSRNIRVRCTSKAESDTINTASPARPFIVRMPVNS